MKTIKDIPEHRCLREKLRKRALVDSNRELIVRMEAKIQARLAVVWGEEPDSCIPASPRLRRSREEQEAQNEPL